MNEPWYASHTNLWWLCRYLVNEHGFDVPGLLHVLEEPWKWEAEFRASLVTPTPLLKDRKDVVRKTVDQICDAVKAVIETQTADSK